MTENTFSVKGIAARIAYTGGEDEIRQIIRQLRHWTNADLLSPTGDKHTGTGISRQYDAQEVRKAAILLELSRYGVTVDMLEGFGEWVEALATSKQWKAAIEGKSDFVIQMSWEPGDEGAAHWSPKLSQDLLVSREAAKRHQSNFASGIVINLTMIFQRLAL